MPVLIGNRAGGGGPRVGRGAGRATGDPADYRAAGGRAAAGARRVAASPAVLPRHRPRVPGRLRPGGSARVLPGVARPAVSACMVRRPAAGWHWPVAVAAAVCAVVFGFGSVVGGMAEGMAPAVPESTAVVAVAPGESLWQLAQRYAPGIEPRAVVARIEEINGVTAGEVPAGAVLSVPVARK